jgi:phage protein U
MRLGSFGDLVFETSSERILTIPGLSRNVSSNIETHQIPGRQAIVEWISPGEDTVSFEMLFSRQLGVDPKAECERLIGYCKKGLRFPLIVGGAAFGEPGDKWIITEIGEERTLLDGAGKTAQAVVYVTLSIAPKAPVIQASSGKVAKSNVSRRKA